MKLKTLYTKSGGASAIIEFSEDSFFKKVEFVYDMKMLTFTLFHNKVKNAKQQCMNEYFIEGLINLILRCNGDTSATCPKFSFTKKLPAGRVAQHDPDFVHFDAHKEHPHYHVEYSNINNPYPLMQQLLQLLVNFENSMKNNPKERELFCRLGFYLLHEKIIDAGCSPLDINLPLEKCIANFTANNTGATNKALQQSRMQAPAVFATMKALSTQTMSDLKDVSALVDTIKTEITEEVSSLTAREEGEKQRQLHLEKQRQKRLGTFLFFGAVTATALAVNYYIQGSEASGPSSHL